MSASSRSNGGPVLKISLDGGSNVAAFANMRDMPNGARKKFYTVTIQPRRYLDPQTNTWKNATAFSPAEAAAVAWAVGNILDGIAALQAQDHESAGPTADQPTDEAGSDRPDF